MTLIFLLIGINFVFTHWIYYMVGDVLKSIKININHRKHAIILKCRSLGLFGIVESKRSRIFAFIRSSWTLWVSWAACDRLWSFFPFRPKDKTHFRPAGTLLCRWNTSPFPNPIFLSRSFLHTRQNFLLSALCSGFLSFSFLSLKYLRLLSFLL